MDNSKKIMFMFTRGEQEELVDVQEVMCFPDAQGNFNRQLLVEHPTGVYILSRARSERCLVYKLDEKRNS